MRNFDNEIATIRTVTTVIASATALVHGFASRVEAAIEAFKANNPEADTTELDAVIDAARSQADDLAAAVAENTGPVSIAPGSGQESTGSPQGQGTSGGAEDQTHDAPVSQEQPTPAGEEGPTDQPTTEE